MEKLDAKFVHTFVTGAPSLRFMRPSECAPRMATTSAVLMPMVLPKSADVWLNVKDAPGRNCASTPAHDAASRRPGRNGRVSGEATDTRSRPRPKKPAAAARLEYTAALYVDAHLIAVLAASTQKSAREMLLANGWRMTSSAAIVDSMPALSDAVASMQPFGPPCVALKSGVPPTASWKGRRTSAPYRCASAHAIVQSAPYCADKPIPDVIAACIVAICDADSVGG